MKFHSTDVIKLLDERRTPHGVRGLKYIMGQSPGPEEEVAPRTGCVD